MFHAAALPRMRKRPRPEEVPRPGREDVKFRDVRVYLVEMKMGRSRRSFLTQLARSKGFMVEEVLRLEQAFASALHYENRLRYGENRYRHPSKGSLRCWVVGW